MCVTSTVYATEYGFNACKFKLFVASRHKQPLAKFVKPMLDAKKLSTLKQWPHLARCGNSSTYIYTVIHKIGTPFYFWNNFFKC